jgi:hypothetical protein
VQVLLALLPAALLVLLLPLPTGGGVASLPNSNGGFEGVERHLVMHGAATPRRRHAGLGGPWLLIAPSLRAIALPELYPRLIPQSVRAKLQASTYTIAA